MMQLISKGSAILFISFAKNNILCTFSSLEGKTLFFTSIGSVKVRGLKKITNTTLLVLVKKLNHQIKRLEINFLYLRFLGTNRNKNDFFKLLKSLKVNVPLIQNQNRAPHSGCKVPRPRKV